MLTLVSPWHREERQSVRQTDMADRCTHVAALRVCRQLSDNAGINYEEIGRARCRVANTHIEIATPKASWGGGMGKVGYTPPQ